MNGLSFDLDLMRARARGTAAGLEQAVLDNVPHVTAVRVHDAGKPGVAFCRVRMRWYAWLTLGLLHLLTWWRAHQVIEHERAAGVAVRVRVR